jgi:hypothetical protein
LKGKIEADITSCREEQRGFRGRRSCLDNIFCVRHLIEKIKEYRYTYDIYRSRKSLQQCSETQTVAGNETIKYTRKMDELSSRNI